MKRTTILFVKERLNIEETNMRKYLYNHQIGSTASDEIAKLRYEKNGNEMGQAGVLHQIK